MRRPMMNRKESRQCRAVIRVLAQREPRTQVLPILEYSVCPKNEKRGDWPLRCITREVRRRPAPRRGGRLYALGLYRRPIPSNCVWGVHYRDPIRGQRPQDCKTAEELRRHHSRGCANGGGSSQTVELGGDFQQLSFGSDGHKRYGGSHPIVSRFTFSCHDLFRHDAESGCNLSPPGAHHEHIAQFCRRTKCDPHLAHHKRIAALMIVHDTGQPVLQGISGSLHDRPPPCSRCLHKRPCIQESVHLKQTIWVRQPCPNAPSPYEQ